VCIKNKGKKKRYRKKEIDLLMLQAVTLTSYTQSSLEKSTFCYTIKVTTITIPSA
jgi:hypothetical protein